MATAAKTLLLALGLKDIKISAKINNSGTEINCCPGHLKF